jgi:gliding motility-associated protein GldC
MEKIAKYSKINITVGLDGQNVPVSIDWMSEDGPTAGKSQPGKAMLLSLFDKESLDTLKIDLWTKEMQVKEMDRFFYQTLRALADTYFKATQNQDLAAAMQSFVQYFGEKTEMIPPAKK